MAKPIFVLGVHRSGTTWLANILCSHSKIAGVQAERHNGLHESTFFCIVKDRYGDINKDNQYIEFIETFSNSDYFILTNLNKDYFYEHRAKSYDEFFKMMMDTFADQQQTEFWIEKTPAHTVYFNDLIHLFPTGKFIIVKRNIIDAIKSDVRLRYYDESMHKKIQTPKISFILFLIFRYLLYYKTIDKYEKQAKCLTINYEELRQDREYWTKKICTFLEIEFEPQLMVDKFKPNTKFKSTQERQDALTKNEEQLIRTLYRILKIIPKQLYTCFIPLYKKEFQEKAGIPDWFYTIKKEKLTNNIFQNTKKNQ